MTVWMDASSLATGVALEVNRDIMEDTCWLCHSSDAPHVNLVELNPILKGINLALQWKMKVLHLITDSVCTYHWINSLTRKACLKTKAVCEMLMQRQLGTLWVLTVEYGLTLDVRLTNSNQNKADKLIKFS